jgi:hypothetical protein
MSFLGKLFGSFFEENCREYENSDGEYDIDQMSVDYLNERDDEDDDD